MMTEADTEMYSNSNTIFHFWIDLYSKCLLTKHYSLFQIIWVCILCRKKQELLTKTGTWMATISGEDPDVDFGGTGISKSPLFDKMGKEIVIRQIGGQTVLGSRKGGITSEMFHHGESHQDSQSEPVGSVVQHHSFQRAGNNSSRELDSYRTRSSLEGRDMNSLSGCDVPESLTSLRHISDSYSGQYDNTDKGSAPDIRVERGYQSTSSSTGLSYGSIGQSSGPVGGMVSPLDTSGSGHGSGEGGSVKSEEIQLDHLDPCTAFTSSRSHKRMDPMVRNDSMSSDQSESVRPRPPRPHKIKTRDRRPRQQSFSSSDEEIQSTPDCTSGEEHESSISEKGKSYYIPYFFLVKKICTEFERTRIYS